MFHSGAGGACDCGDSSVMDSAGICPKHKAHTTPQVPLELILPGKL